MKAIVYTQYGPPEVLRLEETPKPTPGDNEVLLKVVAAAINYADWALLNGKPFLVRLMTGGLQKPKNTILGADVAGVVEAVGRNVTSYKPGDAVLGDISGCGFGGFAEYVCAREDVLVQKPANISFEQAAAVPLAAVTALQGLRTKGRIKAGQKVLINGASGGVGAFAVQLAKSFGGEVTAVCSTGKIDLVRSIGANRVLDYTHDDFTQSGQQWDLIIAANGYHPLMAYKRVLSPHGIYVCTGGSMAQIFQSMLLGPLVSLAGGQTMTNLAAQPNQQDLAFVANLLETGKVVPVIDRRYPLDDTAEALRYVGAGHAAGKVVITVDGSLAG